MKNSSIKFVLYGLTRYGWSGVGFNNEKSLNGAIFIVGRYPNFVKEMTNHSSLSFTTNSTFYNTEIFDSPLNAINSLISFSFEVSLKNMVNQTFVLFAENPTNENFHTRTAYRERNFLKDASQNCISTDEIIGAGRAESIHVAPFVIFLVIFITLFFLTVLLRGQQPLKSRTIIPLVSLFSQIGTLVPYFVANVLGFEWRNANVCWIETYCSTIFIKASFIALVLNFVRYMIFINLANFKIAFKETKNQKLFYYTIKTVNFISSPWIALFLTFIYYIFYIGILTLFFYLAKWNCVNYRGNFRLIQGGLGVFLFVILVLFQIIDVISNWRTLIRCKLYEFFITNDPFLFRLETFSILGFLIWFLIYINLGIRGVPALIINGLHYHYIYLASGGSIVILTFIKFLFGLCQKKEQKPQNSSEIDLIFSNNEVSNFFIKFAKNEWSIENPLLKIDIVKYKIMNNLQQRKSITSDIIDKYLNSSAPMEVNIDQTRIQNLKDKIQKEEYNDHLFDEIEETVNLNLLDTYQRFKRSKEYVDYLEKKESNKKLMELMEKKEIKI